MNLSQVYNALLRDKRHLNNLGSSELKSLQQKLRYQKDDLNYLRENVLSGKILEHAKSRENLALKEKITNGEELTKKDVNRLKMMNNLLPVSERLTKEEMDQLENLGQQEEALKKANAQIEHRLKQEKEIRDGYAKFKAEKNAKELAEIATKHGLNAKNLQTFVDSILRRRIFDDDQLSDLLAPLELGWKARTGKELALVKDLSPLLNKISGGLEISGLSAYEK